MDRAAINEIDYRADARAAGRTSGIDIDLGTGTDDQVIVADATGDEDTLICHREHPRHGVQ